MTLAAASVLHLGVSLSLGSTTVSDLFEGAAIPEAAIAAVVAVGALTVLLRRATAWWVALATTLFALLGTAYGLTVTVPRGEFGDMVYHLSLLALLVATVGLLLASRAGRPVRDGSPG